MKNAFGYRMGKPFKDTDKDLTPDVIDCSPNNPRKQGRLGDWLAEKGEQFRSYKQVSHQRKMESLGRKLDVESVKGQIQEQRQQRQMGQIKVQQQRVQVGTQRVRMMNERQRAMGQMPSMFGGGGQSQMPGRMPSLFGSGMPIGLGGQHPDKQQRVKRHKRKKAKYQMVRVKVG